MRHESCRGYYYISKSWAAAALRCECLAFLYDPIRVHNEIIYLGDGIVSSFRFSLRFSFFSPSCETIRRLIKCDHGGLSCCFNIHFLLRVSARPCSSSPYFSLGMKWRVRERKKGQRNQIKSARRVGVEDERESFTQARRRCGPAGGELYGALRNEWP